MEIRSPVDWDEYAKERILTRSRLLTRHHRVVTDVILSWLAVEDTSQSFLEVGCGDGFWLDLLRNLGFRRIKGIDISEHYVEICRRKGHDVELSPVEQYEPNTLYDWVYSIDVLEHLDDPRAMLDRMLQFLKPHGRVLFKVPVYDSLPRRVERVIMRTSRLAQSQRTDPTHIQAFSVRTTRRMIEDAGCRIAKGTCTSCMWRFLDRLPGVLNAGIQAVCFGGRFGDAYMVIAEKAEE